MNMKYVIETMSHLGDWEEWKYFRDLDEAKAVIEKMRSEHTATEFRLVRREWEIIC
jgi:hypothetical protein